MIVKGNIAYELSRPVDLYYFWYARLIAQRLASALLRFLPILVVAFLLPEPYRFGLPSDFIHFLLFLLTLILGLILIIAITMIIYISMFHTLNETGSLLLFSVLGDFFAGLTIPVPLMPYPLKVLAYILPFRYTSDLPFRIYAGNITINEGCLSIGVQLIWIILLIYFGRLWLKKSLKKVVIQGG